MATDLVVPALGESISEAVIARWLKKVGEPTQTDEPVADLETDKVTVQLPAPSAGVLAEQLFAEGATVKVGQVIGRIAEGAAKPARPPALAVAVTAAPAGKTPTPAPPAPAPPAPAPPAPAPPVPVAAKPTDGNGRTAAAAAAHALSPSERRALREQGIDPSTYTPPAATSQSLSVATPPAAATSAPVVGDEIVPMTPLRKRIAERLVQAQHTAAILTTFNEVDMSAVMDLRARHGDAFLAKHGAKLGFMSFFTKAAIAALKEWPGLNAEIRGSDIVYKHHYDIGIAVGSGRGLVVPVVRNADKLGFADIEKEIARLGQRAKDNKLTLEELAGGTFTITNGGIYGSMMSTPLLNFPQTGILGMHNIVKRAVVVGDTIAVRPMMYVALSYDHRIVDGREAVSFLVSLKQRIEAPDRMLFEI